MGEEDTNLGNGYKNRIVGYGLEDPEQLLAHPLNWRGHPTVQRETLDAAIQEVGWVAPVLVNTITGHVIDGHLRVDLALQKGLSRVPVVYLELSESEEAEALSTLDPLSAMAFTNKETLSKLMEDFSSDSSQINKMLADLVGNMPETPACEKEDEDDGDELPPSAACQAKWKVKAGDFFTATSPSGHGDHVVMCGDSTDPDHVRRLTTGAAVEAIFTSPPYDQQRTYRGGMADSWTQLLTGVFDAYAPYFSDDAQVFINLGLVVRESRVIRYWDDLIDHIEEKHGIPLSGWYVWHKPAAMPVPNHGDLNPSHEWIFHFRKAIVQPAKIVPTQDGGDLKDHGSMRNADGTVRKMASIGSLVQDTKVQQSVVSVPPQQGDKTTREHPARFPVALPNVFMRSWPKRIWFDPFLGSGSSILAADQCGELCRGMELDPVYTAMTLERLERAGFAITRMSD